ncbi:hypothetical protein PGTUg99_013015 [Puccinia graminis f. sp. tritici]|uniref:Small ribosomal subunit protein mS35 mitochondrial conserved domain-containing protein n=1 Tax=Puccinia graminis f. sp. tritici TaxID=56615 RepID=A0A5B0Q131_PUCGR|nr:hypothetical protein PGTUg99_013015 [Puccinia graminis f. sp. tritici]
MVSSSLLSTANKRLIQPTRWLIHNSQNNIIIAGNSHSRTNEERRSFSVSHIIQAGGKNKIKVSSKGKFKDHRLGGPGMEEAFDIERDLAKPFAMQDVPAVTHLRWAEARKRLNKLRAIKFQMPSLIKYQQPFVPPPPDAHVIVRTQDDMGFHRGKLDSQRANKKASIQVNLSKIPELQASSGAMHKFKLLSGKRWFESEIRSEFDMSDHHGDPHGLVKISCDDYSTAQMNQKWCSDTLDRLIKEATRLEDADPMSDIPLDPKPTLQRRHRNKHRPWSVQPDLNTHFPKEWLPDSARIRLDSAQSSKKKILIHQKQELIKLDHQLRQLIKWDGIGIAPIGFFNKLDPSVKLEIQQLITQRNQIRDLSNHLDRHYLKNFQQTQSTPSP